MRMLWFLFITILMVCGKSESFEEINESDIKRETSTCDEDQEEVENNLTSNPDNNFTRGKRSVVGEERKKKQQKFHSWGGKRNDDKDEEDKDEEVEEMSSFQFDGVKRDSTDFINQTLPQSFSREENILLYDNSLQEEKRDPENTNGVRKRAHFYDSFLQQVGFYPDFSEQSSKRYPAFNSWAGKRSTAFNSWGGKRAAPFNSWVGKRKAAFNSWGGKRDAAFNSWGGKRATSFNSWGGKRASESSSRGQRASASFNSWGGKRGAAFNSWGGKRAASFNSWGGKRTAAFNSWGGKRDLEEINNWQKGDNVNQDSVEQINDFHKTRNYIDLLTNQEKYDALQTTENTENKEKRSRAFNSWAGKRIASLNSPGGKKSAAFNSWGGKRSSSSFNSWGGKRGALSNRLASQGTSAISSNDVESDDNVKEQDDHEIAYKAREIDHSFKGVSPEIDSNGFIRNIISHWTRNKSNSGGFDGEINKVNRLLASQNEQGWYNKKLENNLRLSGQRNFDSIEEEIKKRSGPAFSSWAGKRAPKFAPWYSNKTPSLLISSGKRRPAFSSWGGKRSQLQTLQGADCSNSNINECQDFTKRNLIQFDENTFDGASREKREVNCSTGDGISSHGRSSEVFRNKRFDRDSKKNRVMTRMLFQGGLSRPMEIKSMSRGLDFYAWGGKRSL